MICKEILKESEEMLRKRKHSPKKTILALRNLPNLVRDRRQNVNQTSSPKPLKRPMPETWLDKLRREKLRDLKENNEASPATPSPKRKRRKLK